MMRYLFIGVCLMYWGCNSDSHSSLSREIMVIPYMVSPIITDIHVNEANLIFSKVAGVDKYQIQVAKTKDEFLSKTGFKKHILHNKIITTNHLDIKLPKHIKKIYWSVRCMMDNDSFAYSTPILLEFAASQGLGSHSESTKGIEMDEVHASDITTFDLKSLKIISLSVNHQDRQVSIVYNLSNNGTIACDVQLHYFASDVTNFTQKAWLLPIMPKVLRVKTHRTISISDVIALKAPNLKGKKLLIVPSIQGEFSSKVIAHEIIR